MNKDMWPSANGRTAHVISAPVRFKILTSLLLVLAVLVSCAAYVYYDRGAKWERNAVEAADHLKESEKKLSDALNRVEKLQSSLDVSESDVRSLEARLTDLSNEKAQARDEAAQASLSASALYDLTRSASSVTALMSQCITYQEQWAKVLTGIASGSSYDRSSVENLLGEMSSTCNNALSSAKVLRSIVDGIR